MNGSTDEIEELFRDLNELRVLQAEVLAHNSAQQAAGDKSGMTETLDHLRLIRSEAFGHATRLWMLGETAEATAATEGWEINGLEPMARTTHDITKPAKCLSCGWGTGVYIHAAPITHRGQTGYLCRDCAARDAADKAHRAEHPDEFASAYERYESE